MRDRTGLLVLVVSTVLLAGGCAASGWGGPHRPAGADDAKRLAQVAARQRLIADQERVDGVAEKLLATLPASAHSDSSLYVGFRFADHTARANALMAEAVGLSDPVRPFVYSIDPSGPAAEAGVQLGDQIVAVGDELVRHARQLHKLFSERKASSATPLRILRQSRVHEVTLTRRYRRADLDVLVLGDPTTVNAFATRDGIVVTTGMLDFLQSDGELAVILGHELAHVVRGHFSSSYLIGFSHSFSQDLEREADRYGLEFAHRAGYDPEVGVDVWERFRLELPAAFSEDLLSTHPPSRERRDMARRVAARLKSQVRAVSRADAGS